MFVFTFFKVLEVEQVHFESSHFINEKSVQNQ